MGRKEKKQSFFAQSALKEIALLRKHFKIKGSGEHVYIAEEILASNIPEFFQEYFAFVRPPNLGVDKILPKPDGSILRAWYVGQPDVNYLLNLVVRHALYVEQIVVTDPFIILPHNQVLERPQVWAEVIINRALCLCALEDWIREEIVLIIPSIFHYVPELEQTIARAPHAFFPRQTNKAIEKFEQLFLLRFLVHELPENREAALDFIEMKGKVFKQGERDKLLEAAEQHEARYPIRFRLSSKFYERHFKGMRSTSQILDFTLGVPLVLAPIIAKDMGAFLIFEKSFFYELLGSEGAVTEARLDSLQQLAIAFQGLEFPFLHNISLKQALSLRKKGYLNSFRVYLRDLWSTVTNEEENETLEAKVFEFIDRLKAEYSVLEIDWNNIQKELKVKAVTSGLVVGLSAASTIVIGNMEWTVGAIASALAGLAKEQVYGYMGSNEKVQETLKNPLSVFLLLEQ